MGVLVTMLQILLLPENFAGQIFFAVREDVDLSSGDASAHNPMNFQPSADIEGGCGVFQELGRHPGINQST